MLEMTVENVRIQSKTGRQFVVLQDSNHNRRLSIEIGQSEAFAIGMALPGSSSLIRPQTHDLLKSMLEGLDAKPLQVLVTQVVDGIFYAKIILEMAERQLEFDSRPSDAFALAVRTQTPIFVKEDVLEQAYNNEIGQEQKPS